MTSSVRVAIYLSRLQAGFTRYAAEYIQAFKLTLFSLLSIVHKMISAILLLASINRVLIIAIRFTSRQFTIYVEVEERRVNA